MHISWDKFEFINYLVKKSVALPKEQFKRKSERSKYFISQCFMSKKVLAILSKEILTTLGVAKQNYLDYHTPNETRERRVAFVNLTRNYQRFIGYIVNIMEIITDYHEAYNRLCKELNLQNENPIYAYRSNVYEQDMLGAMEELLLRGNQGRFAPFPFIRSALEVNIYESLLNTKFSAKYKDKKITLEKKIDIDYILNSMDNLEEKSLIETDSVRRLYKLASASIHRGIRIPHLYMWFTLRYVEAKGYYKYNSDHQIAKSMDCFLDELQRDCIIKIE